MSNIKARPYDSINMVIKFLALMGYYRPATAGNEFKRIHNLFRVATYLTAFLYVCQHAVFFYQVLGDVDLMCASLSVLLATINVVYKSLVVQLNTHRFDNIKRVMDGPLLAAYSPEDEEIIKQNTALITKVLHFVQVMVTTSGLFWAIAPFISRINDNEVIIPAYYPLKMQEFSGFAVAVLYEAVVVSWMGYGHTAYACFIGAHYAQVTVQIKIIRYNLERLAEVPNKHSCKGLIGQASKNLKYRDLKYKEMQRRLVDCVRRFDQTVWLKTELERIISWAMLVQLLAAAGITCTAVYKLSTLSAFNLTFAYQAGYLGCILTELLIYCFFGNQVAYESNFINESLYLSNWVFLSPSFRKQLLIAMCRWTQHIVPTAAKIIPLSMNTFISVLRGAYTLYTILKQS